MANKVILAGILSILLLPGVFGSGNSSSDNHLLIYEVSPYSYAGKNLDYVCIINSGDNKINLKNYYLTDFEGYLHLHGYIKSTQKLYIAQNRTSFKSVFGFYPDYIYNDLKYNGSFSLSNKGDEVALIKDGHIEDILIYGHSKYRGDGWIGNSINVSQGHVIRRKNLQDTNSSDDWTNYHRIGQSDFSPIKDYSRIEIFTYPDDSHELFRFVNQAKKEILIESYTLSNFHLENILEEKIREGVRVKILLEGSPVGGMSDEEKYAVQRIYSAGGEIYFMISSGKVHNRYTYIHSKFIVIDRKYTLISTENFNEKSITPCGNRGYGVIVRSEKVAEYLKTVFEDDTKTVEDVMRYSGEFAGISLDEDNDIQIRSKRFDTMNLTASISLIIAPDYSLSEFDQFVDEQRWMDVEALYVKDYPLSEIYGKSKRILVNYPTEGYEMREFNGKKKLIRMLHAKLLIGNVAVLVGSMNFGYSSMTRNREVSIIVENRSAVNYFEKVFKYDWNNSDEPVALMNVKKNDNRVTVDMSQSAGNVKEYRIYVDGKLRYEGKNPKIIIDLGDGTHIIKGVIVDSFGNEDYVEAMVTINNHKGTIDPRLILLLLLFALFAYKVWKNHG